MHSFVVTLYAMLPPLGLAWLPVGTITAVPLPDDPTRAEVHVYLVDDPLTESSGWSHRIAWALSVWQAGTATFGDVIDGWRATANGVTWDLSVELVDADSAACTQSACLAPDGLAIWLQGLEESVLVEHVLLSAEVEMLSVVAGA